MPDGTRLKGLFAQGKFFKEDDFDEAILE